MTAKNSSYLYLCLKYPEQNAINEKILQNVTYRYIPLHLHILMLQCFNMSQIFPAETVFIDLLFKR